MEYISVTEFANRHRISERTARNYCAVGKIEGAILVGKTWSIPADTELPARKKREGKISPLLAVLREQKSMGLKGGIYHEPVHHFRCIDLIIDRAHESLT